MTNTNAMHMARRNVEIKTGKITGGSNGAS